MGGEILETPERSPPQQTGNPKSVRHPLAANRNNNTKHFADRPIRSRNWMQHLDSFGVAISFEDTGWVGRRCMGGLTLCIGGHQIEAVVLIESFSQNAEEPIWHELVMARLHVRMVIRAKDVEAQ